jgi:hypothetical protein
MSKKLIAVSAAAALALTGLVGIAPAHATAATITYSDGKSATATNGTTSGTAFLVNVPQTNALTDALDSSAGTVLKIAVANLVAGDTVKVDATAPARVTDALISATTLVDVTKLGSSSVTSTVTGSNTSATLYVFTTSSTAISTISVTVNETNGSAKSTITQTRFLKGQTGAAWRVTNVVAPTTLASGAAEADVTFNVTDAFGNQLESSIGAGAIAVSTGTTDGLATWDTVRKVYIAKVTSTTNNPFVITIDGNGSSNAAPPNVGLGASATTFAAVVNNTGVSAQVAALTEQVATLTTQLAASVTKKKYNKLARKWNRANPSNKVKLAR